MYLEEFIAEIESDLSSYAESGDIDKVSIKRWVMNELKRFGNDLLETGEEILEVKNSSTTLPQTFKSLKLAMRLDRDDDRYFDDDSDDSSYSIKQFIKNPAYFMETTGEYQTDCNSEIITEKTKIRNRSPYYKYRNPKFLSLTKGIKTTGVIDPDCYNLNPYIRENAEYEISITGNQINANFREGFIYLQYTMLPTDENGELYIPETRNGFLEKYLEFYVKSRIVENLIANNRSPQTIGQLLSLYKQEAQNYLPLALRESKFKGLGQHWAKRFKRLSHRNIITYDLPKLLRIPNPRYY